MIENWLKIERFSRAIPCSSSSASFLGASRHSCPWIINATSHPSLRIPMTIKARCSCNRGKGITIRLPNQPLMLGRLRGHRLHLRRLNGHRTSPYSLRCLCQRAMSKPRKAGGHKFHKSGSRGLCETIRVFPCGQIHDQPPIRVRNSDCAHARLEHHWPRYHK